MKITLTNPGTWRKRKIAERYGCTMDEARRLKAGETVELAHLDAKTESVENITEEVNNHGH
jgi:hypothetical protein